MVTHARTDSGHLILFRVFYSGLWNLALYARKCFLIFRHKNCLVFWIWCSKMATRHFSLNKFIIWTILTNISKETTMAYFLFKFKYLSITSFRWFLNRSHFVTFVIWWDKFVRSLKLLRFSKFIRFLFFRKIALFYTTCWKECFGEHDIFWSLVMNFCLCHFWICLCDTGLK